MVFKGQEESESSSQRNFLSRFCSLQQNVNKSVLLFFSQRTHKGKKHSVTRRPVLMVWWKVTVRKIATASNNVHINMCTKLSEKNCTKSRIMTEWLNNIHIHNNIFTNVSFCMEYTLMFCSIKNISGPFLYHHQFSSHIFTLHTQVCYWVFHND